MEESSVNIALIFAGGSVKRMGSSSNGIPKQFLEINRIPIIIRTLEHFDHHPDIDAICVVCIESWISKLKKYLKNFKIEKVCCVVPGGKDGQESIRNGLKTIEEQYGQDDVIVLIHDGVRPLINEQVISDNIETVKKCGNAVTVAPAIETIAFSEDGESITTTLNRDKCFIARAPQSFYLKDILQAHERALADEIATEMVDSASLMMHYGHKLNMVNGPAENIKVTTPTDFYTCRAYLQKKEDLQVWGL